MEEVESSYSINMEMAEEEMVVEEKKVRAAALGVADLMKTLKPKKRGPINKGRKTKAGSAALGGQSTTHSQ